MAATLLMPMAASPARSTRARKSRQSLCTRSGPLLSGTGTTASVEPATSATTASRLVTAKCTPNAVRKRSMSARNPASRSRPTRSRSRRTSIASTRLGPGGSPSSASAARAPIPPASTAAISSPTLLRSRSVSVTSRCNWIATTSAARSSHSSSDGFSGSRVAAQMKPSRTSPARTATAVRPMVTCPPPRAAASKKQARRDADNWRRMSRAAPETWSGGTRSPSTVAMRRGSASACRPEKASTRE